MGEFPGTPYASPKADGVPWVTSVDMILIPGVKHVTAWAIGRCLEDGKMERESKGVFRDSSPISTAF